MRNICRRLMALEKSAAALRVARRGLVEAALRKMSLESLEWLVVAFGADREGRPLNDAELMARQTYASELETECRRARAPLPTLCERIPDIETIHRALVLGLTKAFAGEHMELVTSGIEAERRGCKPNESEAAAIQACCDYVECGHRGAGFRSSADFASARARFKDTSGGYR